MNDSEIIEKAKFGHFEIMNPRVCEDYDEWQTRETVEQTLKEAVLLARTDEREKVVDIIVNEKETNAGLQFKFELKNKIKQETLREVLEWLKDYCGDNFYYRGIPDIFKEKFRLKEGGKQ